MTYKEILEMVEYAVDELKSDMQDEINTVQQELDCVRCDLEELRMEIEA